MTWTRSVMGDQRLAEYETEAQGERLRRTLDSAVGLAQAEYESGLESQAQRIVDSLQGAQRIILEEHVRDALTTPASPSEAQQAFQTEAGGLSPEESGRRALAGELSPAAAEWRTLGWTGPGGEPGEGDYQASRYEAQGMQAPGTTQAIRSVAPLPQPEETTVGPGTINRYQPPGMPYSPEQMALMNARPEDFPQAGEPLSLQAGKGAIAGLGVASTAPGRALEAAAGYGPQGANLPMQALGAAELAGTVAAPEAAALAPIVGGGVRGALGKTAGTVAELATGLNPRSLARVPAFLRKAGPVAEAVQEAAQEAPAVERAVTQAAEELPATWRAVRNRLKALTPEMQEAGIPKAGIQEWHASASQAENPSAAHAVLDRLEQELDRLHVYQNLPDTYVSQKELADLAIAQASGRRAPRFGGLNLRPVEGAPTGAGATVAPPTPSAPAPQAAEAPLPPGITDWVRAVRYSSMLSSPRTFAVNAVGNAIEVPWRLARDVASSAARGQVREVAPEVRGLWAGMVKGSDAFMDVLAHGVTAEQAARGDLPRTLASRVQNPAGKAIATGLEFPSRLLQAADEFAHATAYGMAVGRQAAVQASRQGKRGANWTAEVERLMANPTDAMAKESLRVADAMTYKSEMGTIGTALGNAVKQAGFAGHIVMPFYRTVWNISTKGIERSPLGLAGTALDVARGAYRGGKAPAGVTPLGERLSENVAGSLATLWFGQQAMAGTISGAGPSNQREKDELVASGWQPYSVKVGDRWISYANWGPVAVPLAQSAAIGESWRYKETQDVAPLVADAAGRFAGLIAQQPYLQGIGALYNGLKDPERYGAQWLQQFMASLVPYGGAVNTLGQSTDPYQRETSGVAEGVQARIPGLRQQLPIRKLVTGEPAPNPAYGAGALSPLRVSQQAGQPRFQEVFDVRRQLVANLHNQPFYRNADAETRKALDAKLASRFRLPRAQG